MTAIRMSLHAGAVIHEHMCVGLVKGCLRTHRNNDSEADKCSPCMHVDDAGELVAGVIGLQDELPIISCRQHEARRYQLEIARYCGTS